MAKFVIEKVLLGEKGKNITEYWSISNIIFDGDETEVVLPDTHEGERITLLGFKQAFTPAHEHWHDWQHPGQGSEGVNDSYGFDSTYIRFPKSCKRLVLSQYIDTVCYHIRDGIAGLYVDVVPENKTFCSKKGRLDYKRG